MKTNLAMNFFVRTGDPRSHVLILSFAVAASMIAASILNGCSGGMSRSTMAPAAIISSFAMVSNSGSGSISVFGVSPSGDLSQIPESPFPAGAGAEFMALDSVHKILFVSNQNSNNLSVFSVNTSTGNLSPVPGSPFATGLNPHGVAVDAAGKFVFVGNQDDNTISVFSINATNGALTPVSGSPFFAGSPFGLTVNPAGTFLFVNNINSNTVSGFQIDSISGALNIVPGASFATGQTPIAITADPNGKFLYVGDHMQDTISAFNVDPASGALTRTSGPTAASQGCTVSCHDSLRPLRIAIDPADKFAYVTNVGGNSVSAFSLSNGALFPVSAPVATGQHPFGVALDPSGNFLYVVNKVDNNISAYAVNPGTGMFSPLSGSPFAVGSNAPTGIVMMLKQ